MTAFSFTSRGEAFSEWYLNGEFRAPAEFIEMLRQAPAPILKEAEFGELLDLLHVLPAKVDRWSIKHRREGKRFADLVAASASNAIVPEAKTLLEAVLRGERWMKRGRPQLSPSLVSGPAALDSLAAHIFSLAEKHFANPACMDVPFLWAPIPVYPDLADVPLKRRALETTHRMMLEKGFRVPSVDRLRNRISAYRVRRRQSAKPPRSEQPY